MSNPTDKVHVQLESVRSGAAIILPAHKPELRLDGVVDYTKCGIHRHPGGVEPCLHCKKPTGAWCPHCGTFSCAVNIGCLGAHNAVCQTIKDHKLGRVA